MTPTSLTLIITTKNEEHNLPRLLESIRRNGISPTDVIVVDNFSHDGTAKIVTEFGARLHLAGPNQSVQRNIGIKLCSSSYVMILDADMELADGLVAEVSDLLRDGNKCIILAEESVSANFWSHVRKLERSLYAGDTSIEAARVFSVELFNAAGGYDPQITGGEDWLLARSIYAMVAPVRTKALAYHHEGRLTALGIARKYMRYGRGYYRLFRINRALFYEHANVLRPSVIQGSARFLRHPFLFVGLVAFRIITHSSGLLGFMLEAVTSTVRPSLYQDAR